ncbi:MAG: nucleoside triphosphate pyrophosphohydrolase [Patescibacteria group bacterium]
MKNPERYPIDEYNKLVRDKIPKIIESQGGIPVIHIAYGEEYIRRVREKLKEEVDELLHAETREKAEEEMGDIIEVLHAYAQISGTEMKIVESRRQAKHTTKGGFATGVVLERVEKP